MVGSTATVDARDNTMTTGTGVPIYWVNGNKVADNYADFYDGTWDDVVGRRNESGTASNETIVFTGSNNDGTKDSRDYLGSTVIGARVGSLANADRSNPLDSALQVNSALQVFYGLSPVFRVDHVSLCGSPTPVPSGTSPPVNLAAAVTFDFAKYDLSAAGGGYATITVKRTGTGAASVKYATADHTLKAADGHYVATSGTLRFASGETSKSFTVPLGYKAGSFRVFLKDANRGAVCWRAEDRGSTVRVSAATPPGGAVFELLPTTDLAVREDAGTATLKVWKTGTGAGSVEFSQFAGTASSAAGDYQLVQRTLDFGASEREKTITVPILNDNLHEPEEFFILQIRSASGGTIKSGAETRLVRILDDDPAPVIGFARDVYTAYEGDGPVTLTVTKTGATAVDATVNVATVDHTTTAGSDYTALNTSTTLTITPSSTVGTIQVHPIVDSTTEGSELFRVILSNPGNATLGRSEAYVLLRDGDAPTSRQVTLTPTELTISASPATSVTEGGDVTFTVTSDPAPQLDLTVNVGHNEEMGADLDYVGQGETTTVTIPAGQTTASWTVTTMSDDVERADGEVSGRIMPREGYYTLGDPSSVTLALIDDDAPQTQPQPQSAQETQDATPTPEATAIPADLVAQVRALAGQTHHGTAHVNRWKRVLIAFGLETYPGLSATTAAEARENAKKYSSPLWPRIAAVLAKLEVAPEPVVAVNDDPPATPEPVVTLSAGDGVTEGGDAVFTLTASPAPAAALDVSVTVAANGDYGVTAGSRTVTFAANAATATLTLPTAGDAVDEPDGSVTATVEDGTGYTVGSAASGTVAVQDDDDPLPEITISAGDAVTEGGDAVFTLTASRALASALDVSVTVATDGDWGVSAGSRTVSIGTTGSATLTLPTADDALDEPDGSVTATVVDGSGYTVGSAASGTVAVRDDDLPPPVISIAAKASSVTEGGDAVFTLTADRAVDADLTIKLTVAEAAGSDHVAAAHEGAATATLAKGAAEAVFTVATVDDALDEPDGSVTVTVGAGSGYTVAASPGDAAGVEVLDNDAAAGLPALSVDDATAKEGEGLPVMEFTVRLTPAATVPVSVHVSTKPSVPESATPGVDYMEGKYDLTFRPGQTEKQVYIWIWDDSHDEEAETFRVVLSKARGAAIGDGVAVGTIVNDDPMPAAWLARFGRTVAEQALDGIAGRMAADRTPGMQGAIAGQSLSFDPAASGAAGPGHAATGAPASDGTGALALSEVAQAFGGHPANGNHGFGNGTPGIGHGVDTQPPQSQTMTARDALLGSSFSLTGERDGAGGSMAFWGRAAQGSFDGREGTFSLDGEATTAMLGADYARGKWLVGLALAQSTGEGDYRDTGAGPQGCPDDMDAELCDRAVRAGDGSVEASLTAAIPYAALQVSERLKLWGAAGHGTGEVTLKTETGGRYEADTSWSMAAAGVRGDLLAPPAEGSGPALAVTSDALWTRTSSERTSQLAASDSDTTRLRIGLEGSYRIATEGGGHLTPKVEIGARHDGGDAETGSGLEVGGGIAWVDPGIGLTLDVSGRTLIAHGDDDLENRGFAAALAYDPAPATGRGLSLGLRQEYGGRASGGLDALFQPAPLDERAGGGELASRWSLEAAYGFPAFGGRFTGSPHVGLGLATGARDYTLGWRLAPEAATAPDVSFGLKATRRESDTAAPEHMVGFEVRATW